ncbi:MAG: hypothetical protein IPK26_02080 [Planctomycetes bacterium]|nr:hypothetical protein [Planctomycetota bacterium]
MSPLQTALGLGRDHGRQLQWLAESGFMALALEQRERARRIFAGLQVLAPDEPVGWLGLAELELAAGRPDAARDEVDLALRKPNCELDKMIWAWRLRAHVCAALGDADGQIAAEDAVLRLQPDGPVALAIAQERAGMAAEIGGE